MRAWSVLGGAVDVQRVDHHGDGVIDSARKQIQAA
jgi:hypothetical protein